MTDQTQKDSNGAAGGASALTAGLGAAANVAKKKWTIEISQNGWEYSGWITVTAVHVEKTGDKSVIADGMEIAFDEEIGDIECEAPNYK